MQLSYHIRHLVENGFCNKAKASSALLDVGHPTMMEQSRFGPVARAGAALLTTGSRDSVKDMSSLALAHLNSSTRLEIGSDKCPSYSAEAFGKSEPLPHKELHWPFLLIGMDN